MTITENAASPTTHAMHVENVLEGDVIIERGAQYRVVDEPLYVRRGQLYVRLSLRAVEAGNKTGLINGFYDIVKGTVINIVL